MSSARLPAGPTPSRLLLGYDPSWSCSMCDYPDLDGFEVAARLADTSDPPGVILTSTRSASSYRRRLAGCAALGFIGKGELSRETLAALCG